MPGGRTTFTFSREITDAEWQLVRPEIIKKAGTGHYPDGAPNQYHQFTISVDSKDCMNAVLEEINKFGKNASPQYSATMAGY